jgi:hypothetical protein
MFEMKFKLYGFKFKYCGSCKYFISNSVAYAICIKCSFQSKWESSKEFEIEMLKFKIERCLNL